MKRPDKLYVIGRIRKYIYNHLDNNDWHSAIRLVGRYNRVRRYFFSGEPELTPGQVMDDYIETRVFEAKL